MEDNFLQRPILNAAAASVVNVTKEDSFGARFDPLYSGNWLKLWNNYVLISSRRERMAAKQPKLSLSPSSDTHTRREGQLTSMASN